MDALSTNNELERRVKSTYDQLERLARENLADKLKGYTGPQKLALIRFSMLELAADLDLVPLMVRGQIMEEIHKMSLHTQLPGSYNSEEEALEALGKLSRSEQSNIKDLTGVIFPYVQEHLGMSIQEFWTAARSKSNIREAVPYLKVAITGELSKSEAVNEAVKRLQAEVGTDTDMLVDHIIDLAAAETNKGLRRALRPNASPPINAVMLRRNGTRYLLAEMTEDDVNRVLATDLFEIAHVSLEEYQPEKIPVVRRLIGG